MDQRDPRWGIRITNSWDFCFLQGHVNLTRAAPHSPKQSLVFVDSQWRISTSLPYHSSVSTKDGAAAKAIRWGRPELLLTPNPLSWCHILYCCSKSQEKGSEKESRYSVKFPQTDRHSRALFPANVVFFSQGHSHCLARPRPLHLSPHPLTAHTFSSSSWPFHSSLQASSFPVPQGISCFPRKYFIWSRLVN